LQTDENFTNGSYLLKLTASSSTVVLAHLNKE